MPGEPMRKRKPACPLDSPSSAPAGQTKQLKRGAAFAPPALRSAEPARDSGLSCEEGLDDEDAPQCSSTAWGSAQAGDAAPGVVGMLSAVSKWSLDSLESEGCQFSLKDCPPTGEALDHERAADELLLGSPPPSGGVPGRPTRLGSVAAFYSFTAFTFSVGASYFGRLAARDARLCDAATHDPEFADFVRGVLPDREPLSHPLGSATSYYSCHVRRWPWPPSRFHATPAAWLTAVLLTCVLVAAKVVDRVHYSDLHRVMLTRSCGARATAAHACALELECLQALRWRLGPFFGEAP